MSMNRRTFLGVGAALSTLPAVAAGPETKNDLLSKLAPLTVADYEARMERARQLLAEQHLDALYVESGSTLHYFAGFAWGRSERMFALIIPRRGAPAFVCPAFERQRAEEQILFPAPDLRSWEEDASPYAVVRQILQDRTIAAGKIGIEPSTRFFLVAGMSREAPGLECVDGSPVSDGCRMKKGPQELAYMKAASLLTKQAYQAAFRKLHEGMTPAELGAAISDEHRRLGVQGGASVSFGPNSAFPHGSRVARPLQVGDIVLVDGGCSVHGYRSDVTRTVVFGNATDKQRRLWDIVKEAQTAALRAARPGVPCGELDAVARKVIEDAGYGPDYKYFTHRLGHGIGLDGHEEPYLVRGNKLPLQAGMTFSDEPGIYLYGEFGVRHEDIMVITENAAEFFGEEAAFEVIRA